MYQRSKHDRHQTYRNSYREPFLSNLCLAIKRHFSLLESTHALGVWRQQTANASNYHALSSKRCRKVRLDCLATQWRWKRWAIARTKGFDVLGVVLRRSHGCNFPERTWVLGHRLSNFARQNVHGACGQRRHRHRLGGHSIRLPGTAEWSLASRSPHSLVSSRVGARRVDKRTWWLLRRRVDNRTG